MFGIAKVSALTAAKSAFRGSDSGAQLPCLWIESVPYSVTPPPSTVTMCNVVPAFKYATESAAAPSAKLMLNFVCPHQVILDSKEVERVDIPATAGDMGILSNHVPTIQQLKPGAVEITADGASTKYFVSSGFAVVNPDNSININVLEAVTADQVDKNAIKSALNDATARTSKGTEEEKVLAAAEVEVYEALDKFMS